MSEETTFTRRTKGLLKEHGKTALGGISGAGLVTVVAVVMPYIHDIKDTQVKLWEQNGQLKERVVRLETKVESLEKVEYDKLTK